MRHCVCPNGPAQIPNFHLKERVPLCSRCRRGTGDLFGSLVYLCIMISMMHVRNRSAWCISRTRDGGAQARELSLGLSRQALLAGFLTRRRLSPRCPLASICFKHRRGQSGYFDCQARQSRRGASTMYGDLGVKLVRYPPHPPTHPLTHSRDG